MRTVNREVLLLGTVALLTVYVIGVGGATATAIRARESWRAARRVAGPPDLDAARVVLAAPTVPRAVAAIRVAGWIAFFPVLVLAIFTLNDYPWLPPVTLFITVGLNAFYFTASQALGSGLTVTADGFETGGRVVRWIHVTDITGAHVGAFRAARMAEPGEWQDPRLAPNVIFYRLNRALVLPRKSLLQRWTGLSYFDGMIRNTFGVPTEQLIRAMRDRQRRALEAEGPPLGRAVKNRAT